MIAVLAAAGAGAFPARVARLSYERGEGADGCPDAASLKQGIAARLGYNPFVDEAELKVSAVVSRAGTQLRGILRLERDRADAGPGSSPAQAVGQRELTGPASDCRELASAMELAISIAIDPLVTTRPAAAARDPQATEGAAAEPAPRQSATPSPPPPDDVAASVPAIEPRQPLQPDSGPVELEGEPFSRNRPRPAKVHAYAGLGVAVASMPLASPSLQLGARLQWKTASVGLEARVDPISSYEVAGGRIDSALVVGSVVACLHYRRFAGCGLVSAGALTISGAGYDDARQGATPYVAVGGRAVAELFRVRSFSFAVSGDLVAPIVHTSLQVSGGEVWKTPALAGGVGLCAVKHFP